MHGCVVEAHRSRCVQTNRLQPLAASCSLLQPLGASCILLHPLCAWFHSVGYAYSHSDSYRLCRFVFAKHTTDRAMGKSKKAKKLANLRGPLVSQASKPKKKNRKSLAKPPASPQTPMVKTPPAVPVNPQLPPNAPSCPVARPPTIMQNVGHSQLRLTDRARTRILMALQLSTMSAEKLALATLFWGKRCRTKAATRAYLTGWYTLCRQSSSFNSTGKLSRCIFSARNHARTTMDGFPAPIYSGW